MIESEIDIILNNKKYNYIGAITDYYYDLSLVPIDGTYNILELNKLLYGLYVQIDNVTSCEKPKFDKNLQKELINFFSKYNEKDFYHYELYYESLVQFQEIEFNYIIDKNLNNIKLYLNEIEIVLNNYPNTIINIYGEDINGEIDYEIEKYKLIKIEFEELEYVFMTDEEERLNKIELDKKYNELITIFSKYTNELVDEEYILKFYENLNN
jgi:hypothetical protein